MAVVVCDMPEPCEFKKYIVDIGSNKIHTDTVTNGANSSLVVDVVFAHTKLENVQQQDQDDAYFTLDQIATGALLHIMELQHL